MSPHLTNLISAYVRRIDVYVCWHVVLSDSSFTLRLDTKEITESCNVKQENLVFLSCFDENGSGLLSRLLVILKTFVYFSFSSPCSHSLSPQIFYQHFFFTLLPAKLLICKVISRYSILQYGQPIFILAALYGRFFYLILS